MNKHQMKQVKQVCKAKGLELVWNGQSAIINGVVCNDYRECKLFAEGYKKGIDHCVPHLPEWDIIVEIYSSKVDRSGNRYHFCRVIDITNSSNSQWYTGFSPSNIRHHIRKAWGLHAYYVNHDLPIMEWRRLKKCYFETSTSVRDIEREESFNATERS